jgi:hypothetical protein
MSSKSKSKNTNTWFIVAVVVTVVIIVYFMCKPKSESFHSLTAPLCPQGDDALINVDACRHSLYRYFDLMNLTYESAAGVFYYSFNKPVPNWRDDPYFNIMLKTWHAITPVTISISQKNESGVSANIKTLLGLVTQLDKLNPTNPTLVKIIAGNEALQMTISGLYNITDDLVRSIPIVWTS